MLQNVSFVDTELKKNNMKISGDNINSSQRQEDLLGKIISQLGKMDTKLTSVNGQLSSMDANLSEIKSQMSVMDSRLSAVDMFVTMQRMDKKWQELTSSLCSLENAPKFIEPPTENQMQIVPTCSIPTRVHSEEENNLGKTEFENCNDLSKERLFIAMNDIILISHLPKKPETFQESIIQTSDVLNIKPNVVVDETTQENDVPQEDENKVSNHHTTLDKPETSIPHNYVVTTFSETNVKSMVDDSTQAMISKLDSAVLKNSNKTILETECDKEENDFVFVNKSDINDDLCEQNSQEINSSICTNVFPDYSKCNNITEYLEVNLGKRKDFVYEFGFEAKPDSLMDSLLDSSTSDCHQNQDSDQTSTEDDSLVQCINSLLQSKFANQQQSTPASTSKQVFSNKLFEKCKISSSKDAGKS